MAGWPAGATASAGTSVMNAPAQIITNAVVWAIGPSGPRAIGPLKISTPPTYVRDDYPGTGDRRDRVAGLQLASRDVLSDHSGEHGGSEPRTEECGDDAVGGGSHDHVGRDVR